MAAKHVAIIGAGLGGLCAAIKLQEAGYTFTIVEKLNRVGGTWAQNTYPGVACDVPVALYQFSFAQSINWSRAYPQGEEIQAYAEEIADRYQLRPHLILGDEAVSAVWNETARKWTVATASGEEIMADAVIGALGQLNRPNWPNIPGKDSFKGDVLHSAAWDHSVGLEGKRVGVIGSAASAVQIIPEVAKVASHLTVFQRSPNWVIPRRDI
ncbi:MAG: NAD(P)/FAD-dependent oxidoreductase, partial [Alphaproteobacteria bacterium]|nr:NAD(P)/FAD-dependent oxidoreductase [Alphaproteobacteria bacterium]